MESQRSIADWRVGVFGKSDRPAQVICRALAEFGELMEDVVPGRQHGLLSEAIAECVKFVGQEADEMALGGVGGVCRARRSRVMDEMADVLIILYGAADDMGMDLAQCVDSKMAINRGRSWNVTGPGLGQHK